MSSWACLLVTTTGGKMTVTIWRPLCNWAVVDTVTVVVVPAWPGHTASLTGPWPAGGHPPPPPPEPEHWWGQARATLQPDHQSYRHRQLVSQLDHATCRSDKHQLYQSGQNIEYETLIYRGLLWWPFHQFILQWNKTQGFGVELQVPQIRQDRDGGWMVPKWLQCLSASFKSVFTGMPV